MARVQLELTVASVIRPGRILNDEEASAIDRHVSRHTGGLKGALCEALRDTAQPNACSNVTASTDDTQVAREDIYELSPRRLEADCVGVGDVVTNNGHGISQGIQAADPRIK